MAFATSGLPAASIATSHSVSTPIERLLMLADPMRSHSSSTAIIFECRSMHVPSASPGMCG